MNANVRTSHGELTLPAFLPDATRAVVRTVDSRDLEDCRIDGLVVNILHLSSHPGVSVVGAAGGVHRFMDWTRPVSADSGGFQVFSLIHDNPNAGSITERGFTYRLSPGEPKETLTPEKCIEKQFKLRPDIMFCLDYCTHPDDPLETQRESVRLTVAWARRCKETFTRLLAGLKGLERPLLFAVVQGGSDPDLRRQCAEELREIGFDGYAYGGWPVSDEGLLVEMVHYVAEVTPDDLPRHALGIGKPENVVRAAAMGYDIFDCVIPTRDARHKRLYVATDGFATLGEKFYSNLYLQDKKFIRDFNPVEDSCDCLCCRRYSRAYLHHLFEIGDALALRLATIHNLRFYTRLLERLREVGRDA